ncbi:PfkB family carbohydrate kinase [Jiella sp. M17.18]|uniref:PfkB family carbohydrate kinase n=1 Tax=Jiella sp. M17.18 TaxID=3234247 RepID=UPI0034DF2F62
MKIAETASTPRRVFVAGAAHLDRRGKADGPFIPAASNPGRLTATAGGAAFNAAVALRAFGWDVAFHGARGGDSDGSRVAAAIQDAGIEDGSVTWLDRGTPSYTAILDDRGELVAGIADMALYDLLSPRVLSRRHIRASIAGADALLVDANLPPPAIEALVATAGPRPVAAIAVSPAKVRRLIGVLPALSALVLSRAEAASLTDAPPATDLPRLAELVAERGASRAVVTDGPREAAIVEAGSVLMQRPPTVRPRDVTGAGDTLAAAALTGLAAGLGWTDSVRRGVVAASLRISLEHFPPADLPQRIDDGVAALEAPVQPERTS